MLSLIKCHCFKDQFYRARLESGEYVFFAASKDDPWVEVFARTRKQGEKGGTYTGDYAHYGFSVDKSEWSCGEAPPGAREIRKMMKMLP